MCFCTSDSVCILNKSLMLCANSDLTLRLIHDPGARPQDHKLRTDLKPVCNRQHKNGNVFSIMTKMVTGMYFDSNLKK